MRSRLVTPPITEPISLSEAKAHLRFTPNAEDALISERISMIRKYCENQTQISLMPQTWELVSDGFCCDMLLPHPPVQSITSIKYFDVDGVEQTIPSADYVLDNIDDLRARVVPASGKEWPRTAYGVNVVRVRYVAGYQDASAVPGPLKLYILAHLSHWFVNRSAVNVGNIVTKMEFFDSLIDQYKVWSI